MSEKIYSQEEFDMWKKDHRKNYPKHLETAPETRTSIDRLSEEIKCLANDKMDRSLFWKLFTIGVPLIVAVIGHLYIIYYGGIADLGTGVAVIQTEIQHINLDIQEIKLDIQEASK